MIGNKSFIEELIFKRNMKNDPVREFAIRNKDSPVEVWEQFKTFDFKELNFLLLADIDGIKLKFKYVTLYINDRYG